MQENELRRRCLEVEERNYKNQADKFHVDFLEK